MSRILAFLMITCLPFYAAHAQDEKDYSTTAGFSIGNDQKSMSSVIATIEDRPMYGPQYKWLTLNFYAFSLTPENIADAKAGNLKPIEQRQYEKNYNDSNAKLVLSIDSQTGKMTQVDMAVPGYTCTIAANAKELQAFSEDYRFEKGRIDLKNKGSHECDMGGVKKTLGWDINVSAPAIDIANKE